METNTNFVETRLDRLLLYFKDYFFLKTKLKGQLITASISTIASPQKVKKGSNNKRYSPILNIIIYIE